jgi:hypothetical protein
MSKRLTAVFLLCHIFYLGSGVFGDAYMKITYKLLRVIYPPSLSFDGDHPSIFSLLRIYNFFTWSAQHSYWVFLQVFILSHTGCRKTHKNRTETITWKIFFLGSNTNIKIFEIKIYCSVGFQYWTNSFALCSLPTKANLVRLCRYHNYTRYIVCEIHTFNLIAVKRMLHGSHRETFTHRTCAEPT